MGAIIWGWDSVEGQLLTLEEAQQWGNRATHLDTGVVSNLQMPRARVIWFDMVSSSQVANKNDGFMSFESSKNVFFMFMERAL